MGTTSKVSVRVFHVFAYLSGSRDDRSFVHYPFVLRILCQYFEVSAFLMHLALRICADRSFEPKNRRGFSEKARDGCMPTSSEMP